MRPLAVPDAWVASPPSFNDHRGSFHEWFRGDDVRTVTGRPFHLAQANCSVSRRGVVRGIHFADVPPGQAKYVTCVRGAIRDVVVDLRTGSPSFGVWDTVRLDEENRRAVLLSEGLGHGFQALTGDATVVYLTTSGYDASREHAVDPFDTRLGIAWDAGITPLLSAKDAAALSLTAAEAAGVLPAYAACVTLSTDGGTSPPTDPKESL
ncbi:dTDP-4-dehydrorhamnose 3,5-epimerase family protein [Streptomyces sp. ISL-10]|uniref:dTDP-4-dehydrorhamnose 3,5-epimerase family protein n=1 Tax=Streptomyces sp. ISL-10 TaxID=2819172 RepID=UPI001BE8CBB9|nr:dTDP-4-dehydrorhamnose 3,5-epimerase [Streptomyces sp. ISL-10]MBT2368699.1 dTDP-4-dehydrorhamnose 3,5-epimerase family protein [Streptomyces sp. ISL-10]